MALRKFAVLVAVTVLSSLLCGCTPLAAPSSAEIFSNGTETFGEAGVPEPMAQMASQSSNLIAACPDGFIHFWNSPGCYKILEEALTYDQAYQKCSAQNPAGRLATVETAEEHEYIRNYFLSARDINEKFNWIDFDMGFNWEFQCKSQFWIGLERYNRNDCSSGFYWKKRNGSFTFQEPMGFSAFGKGEPNCLSNIEEGCVQYKGIQDYQWNDIHCDTKMCALCEAPPSSPREGSFPF